MSAQAAVSLAPTSAAESAPAAVRVAYLAPELYAISATFVYEEIAALERRGWEVVPFSVHRPAQAAQGQAALVARTRVLYEGARLAWLTQALRGLAARPAGALRSLGWLVRDMAEVGLWRLQAWKLAFQWLHGARLAGWLAERGCGHLHIHFAHVPTQIGMYAAAIAGIPFTVMAHANDIFERKLLLLSKARRSQRFLTISEFNLRYLRDEQQVPAEKLAIVRCGVSLRPRVPESQAGIAQAAIRPPGGQPASSRTNPHPNPHTAPTGRLRVGSLGRLVEKKGMAVLVQAVALLREQGLHCELEIAGDGPLHQALHTQITQLGLTDRVRLLGSLAHHEVGAWLRGLDLFVLACQQDQQGDMDGVPVALMEAMSQDVPVVSTQLSGVPELVLDERCGLLAQPADAPDLARQIGRLLQDPALRLRLGRAGAEHVHHEFSQAANIDRLIHHILSTPERAPTPGVSAA